MPTIDIHAHFFPESWPDFAARFGTPDWPWLKHLGGGEGMVMVGDREFRRIKQACWDPAVRLEDLDQHGVDAASNLGHTCAVLIRVGPPNRH